MSGTPTRQNSVRVLGAEFNRITEQFQDGDGERAPKLSLLPTGGAANRVFMAGTLTEVNDLEEQDITFGTLVDQSSHAESVDDASVTIFVGEYEGITRDDLKAIDTPEFVSVTGKVNVYEQDDGEISVSVRPEELSVITKAERDRWTAETLNRTLDRIDGFLNGDGENVDYAKEVYGDDISDIIAATRDTLLHVAPDDVAPDLSVKDVDIPETTGEPSGADPNGETDTAAPSDDGSEVDPADPSEADDDTDPEELGESLA